MYCITNFQYYKNDAILAWAGLAWAGLAWPGLAWAGLGWPGLAWAGLCSKQIIASLFQTVLNTFKI